MHNYRLNPYNNVMESIELEDFNAVPKSQPHKIKLREVPLESNPTTIIVRPFTLLLSAITASQTTISLDANLATHIKNDSIIQIDSESMLVTGVSGESYTVTRGYGGSLAVSHGVGTALNPTIVYGPPFSEVGSEPAAGQYRPDYTTRPGSDETWNTGALKFNAADAHRFIHISYVGTGCLADAERAGNDPLRNYGYKTDTPVVAVLSGTYSVPLNVECQLFYARTGTTLTPLSDPGFLVRATGASLTCGTVNVSSRGGKLKSTINYVTNVTRNIDSGILTVYRRDSYFYDDSNGGGSASAVNSNLGGGIAFDGVQIISGANQTVAAADRSLFARKNLICYGAAYRSNRGGGGATILSPYIYLKGSYYANGSGGGGGGCFIFGAERIADEATLYQMNGGGAGWVLKLEQGGGT